MDFGVMKRKELQALCKKHRIPANLSNREMALRLALLVQEDEKPAVIVKKVKFSPENETIIFMDSDSDSQGSRTRRLKNRRRSATTISYEETRAFTTSSVKGRPLRESRRRKRNYAALSGDGNGGLLEGAAAGEEAFKLEKINRNSKTRVSVVDIKCEEPLVENNPKTNSDGVATDEVLPPGRTRRTRKITSLFRPTDLSDETCETMNPEKGANRGNPPRKSARIASKVAEMAELASEKGQKKQRQSRRDAPKGKSNIMEQTLMDGLPIEEELPVINVEMAAPEASESKIDPDLQCNKGDTPRSSENEKEFRRKSAVISPIPSAPVLAVNEVTTEMTLRLDGQGEEKGNSTIESVEGNSQDENIEGGVDDPLGNSMDTSEDSCDYQLLQQVEDPKKDIELEAIIPDHSQSQTHQIDSESKCLDIEERLETEEPVTGDIISLRSNGVYDQSSDGDRAYDDSGQDLLDKVADGGESETYSVNLSEEPENTFESLSEEPEIIRPIFPQAINTEVVEKIDFCNEPATEVQDGTEVLDETKLSREAGFSLECVQARTRKEQKSEEPLNKGLPSVGAIPIDASVDGVNDTLEGILASQVEDDAENIESANKQVMEHSLWFHRSSKSLEAYSTTCLLLKISSPPHGKACGSQTFREGKNESTEKENRGADNDKSYAGKSNEDSSNATIELNQEYNVSIPEFSKDRKGAAEEAASVNDGDLTPSQPLCDNGTDNAAKQTEETLDFYAMDGNSIKSEDLDLSSPSEMIQDMNVDCFVSSSDKRTSEHHGHTTEVTALGINSSLRTSGEGNVEYEHDLFVDANSISESDVGEKEIDENVIMKEDFDEVSESQLGEHSNHTAEAAIPRVLISGDCKDSNDQDDVSAIIQEYMEREIHMDGSTKLDSFGFLNKGEMTRVLIEDAETNRVAEPGLDKVFNDCAVEDEETMATGTERMEIVEKDKGMVADAMELTKSDDAAPTACTDVVVVNHKISGTANAIRETMTQSDEVKFEDVESKIEVSSEVVGSGPSDCTDVVPVTDTISEATNVVLETTTQFDEVKFENVDSKMECSTELDGSASIALDNSSYKDGKGVASEVKVGRVCGDLNSQAINFLTETKVNVDSVLDVSSDDIQCKLAFQEAHGMRDVSLIESGEESLEERIGSDNVKYGIAALNSSPKVEESCTLDSTAVELMIDSAVCSSLTGLEGKESECQAYKKSVINHVEGMELENMDGGIIPRETDSPKQGNIELGSGQRGSQSRRCGLKKEGCQTDDVDFLELNNLFSSNGSKINFKQTGKDLDFQNSLNLGASKDAAVSLVTPASNAHICLTTTEFSAGRKIENNTADSDADLPLFTGFELNLFSEDIQRDEADKIYQRRLEENLMSDTNGDMKRGNAAVNISIVSVEQGVHQENEMVVDIDLLKQNQLVSSDEPNNEIEGSKLEGIASEDSIEAIKIKERSGASTKSPMCDENNAKVEGNNKSSGSEDIPSFAMTSLEEEVDKYGLQVNATMMSAAAECQGDAFVETQETNEFENSINFAASGEPLAGCEADDSKQVESGYSEETGMEVIAALSKIDSTEDMFESMDSSKGASILDVASEEPISGKTGINQLERSSSPSSKHTAEFGGKDSNKGPLNLDVEAAVSEDGQARRGELEFGQERNMYQSINQFAEHTRKIPATPKILQKAHDMKENLQSAKREQIGSVAMSRKSAKRRPLEDLQKNYKSF